MMEEVFRSLNDGVRTLSPGSFAFVMATGIVSTAFQVVSVPLWGIGVMLYLIVATLVTPHRAELRVVAP